MPKETLRPTSAVVPQGELRKLDGAVRELFGLSWKASRKAIRSGKVWLGDPLQAAIQPGRWVAAGETLELRPSAPRPHVARRASLERDCIVYADAHVVVVNKPSGIITVPSGSEAPGKARQSLDALVREILALRQKGAPSRRRAPLGIVQRLDKDTSGLLVFARSQAAKKHLSSQFKEHTTERRYLAIVHGPLKGKRTYDSHLIKDRGDGHRGSTRPGQHGGRHAVTYVESLERLEGATLVACRLETGRTHQIRIHLSEAGHPLVGERVYIRRYRGPMIDAPRTMLHAAELGFVHPVSEDTLRFSADPPEDFAALLAQLQKRSGTK